MHQKLYITSSKSHHCNEIPKEGKRMKSDKEKMKKGIALMMGILMIVTIFAALPTGSATIINTQLNNSRNVQISATNLDAGPLYLGEHLSFYITILNGDSADGEALYHSNLTVSTVIRDENGNTVTSPFSNWIVTEKNDDATINDQLTNPYAHTFSGFQAVVANNARPGTYNLTVTLDYTDNGAANHFTYTGYILFDVARNIDVSDAYPVLYAGQTFTPLSIDVDDSWNGVNGLYLNLSAIPPGIHFDQTWGWIPGDVETDTIGYRVDVDNDMAPGVYPVDYQVQYFNNDGIWCTETGTLDITVEFTPVIEASLTGNQITVTQGNQSIPALGVTFTNTGNVDLRNVEITPQLDGTFFFSPVQWYEGQSGSGDQNAQTQVDKIEIDQLGIGNTATGEWYIALDPYVQAGEHRILFDWTATYFDNGATDNPTHYVDTHVRWWNNDGNDSTPMVPEIQFNDGSGLGAWSSPWMAGPYVMIDVRDDHPDFSANKIVNEETGRDYIDLYNNELIDAEISSDITNFEMVGYTDLKATLQVGPGTPFWDPLDHSARTTSNDIADSDTSVNAGGVAEIWWHVDIDPNAEPGLYTVEIVLSGRNVDTTEYMNTTLTAVVEIRGAGPELMVTGVLTGDVSPGKIFDLNLTITNMGDDTARDVFVILPGDFGYNWNVIDGFVDSISSYDSSSSWGSSSGYYFNNNSHDRNVSSNGVTLEQLNINDAKDIVDLALYIEGVFDSPSAQVWLIKIPNLAPGESTNAVFKMMTNINMVKGRPYPIEVATFYTDSYGNGDMWDNMIVVRTSDPGTPYHGQTNSFAELTSDNVGLLLLIVVFLIFIVLVIGFSMMKGEKKEKPPEMTVATSPTALEPEEEVLEQEEPVESGGETEIEADEPGFTLEEELETTEEGESSF